MGISQCWGVLSPVLTYQVQTKALECTLVSEDRNQATPSLPALYTVLLEAQTQKGGEYWDHPTQQVWTNSK
jgi:hypothetical protein